MIEHNLPNKSAWQQELAQAITEPHELFAALELDPTTMPEAVSASQLFSLMVTRSFLSRMEKGNPTDPLLLQVLPQYAEHRDVPGYTDDPLRESTVNPIPGLLHKYKNRVLFTLTTKCAVNCRFCFRRHFPYGDNNPGTRGWDKAFAYVAADTALNEVILSGGDPLVSPDKLLYHFSDNINAIPHIKRLRIHTRLPIVLPERIDAGFLAWCQSLKQQLIIVTHCNHPQEINTEVKAALQALRNAGVVLLNQTVLLKDINDSAETLIALSETLFDAGVQPYYLHLLDKVAGAAHFDLDKDKALAIHNQMIKQLSGYLVPTLVCEEPGAPAKTRVIA